jgi:hypothetical protein
MGLIRTSDKSLYTFIKNWRKTLVIKSSRLTEEKKKMLIDCGILDEDRIAKALKK